MENDNGLVICPDPKHNPRQVLGSIDTNGRFSVMRYRLGVTYIEATTYKIVCVCGFGTVVTTHSNGKSSKTDTLTP
jgi:hypothetical protein